MGFECDYKIATDYSAEDIYQMLRTNLSFVTGWRDFDGRLQRMIFTRNEGLQITIYKSKNPEVSEKFFGFRPTVTVSFEVARGGHPGFDDGMDNMSRSIDWLQNNVEGDAVFLANRDRAVLLRRNGLTWLDSTGIFWRERDIPLLTFSYEWKDLPA